ncbi:MAG: hypothetical protein ABJJ82_04610, partial [Marinobacter sp.]
DPQRIQESWKPLGAFLLQIIVRARQQFISGGAVALSFIDQRIQPRRFRQTAGELFLQRNIIQGFVQKHQYRAIASFVAQALRLNPDPITQWNGDVADVHGVTASPG